MTATLAARVELSVVAAALCNVAWRVDVAADVLPVAVRLWDLVCLEPAALSCEALTACACAEPVGAVTAAPVSAEKAKSMMFRRGADLALIETQSSRWDEKLGDSLPGDVIS